MKCKQDNIDRIKEEPKINFICNICGMRAARPILCVKDDCPTELLVYGVGPMVRL